MLTFQATLHARPPGAIANLSSSGGSKYQALDLDPHLVATTALPCSFEQAVEVLARLPRMFVEPDGSFVWVSSQGESPWQVDGVLYDRDGHVQFVDIKGTCPAQALDELLSAFGWPDCPVIFQLSRAAVFLDETEFRRWASQKA